MIHHLNCASLHPYIPAIDSIVNCLLLESDDGYLLVDTGFGRQDYLNPSPLVRTFIALLRTPCDMEETALRQVEGFGIDPKDVRHILLTHMHLDHAGGLPDFPWAQVHVHRREYEMGMRRSLPLGPFYRPEHWAHNPNWALYDNASTDWYGFEAIEVLPGIKPRILFLPLPGHSPGHCGVAIELDHGWLLHCGDATYPFYRMEDPRQPYGEPPTWLVHWLLGPHTPKLKALHARWGDEIHLICGHDPVSLEDHKTY
jgi:glyoxylase-like metal-dependent hydrolase (beta-lactamase superfamily II)